MAKNWYTVINSKETKWNIPVTVKQELEGMTEDAQGALEKAMSSERTAVITARCKEAFDILVGKMRDKKKRYFLKPPLTDSDYISLELNPPDVVPTPILPPTSQAHADLTFPGIHLVELQKIRPVSGSAPDARSDYGVRVF
jgi:hypothetical protein